MAKRADNLVQRLRNAFAGSNGIQVFNTMLNLAERSAQRTRLASAPPMVQVEVTNKCNLNCVFCSRHDHDLALGDLPPDLVPDILSFSRKSRELIPFGYGEPLVAKVFNEFMCRGLGATFSFTTNGVLLTQETFGRLVQESGRPIKQITFSIDGANPDTYGAVRERSSFDKVWQNLEDANEYKKRHSLKLPELWINFVAMKRNIEELPEMVRKAADAGVSRIIVFHLVVWDEEREQECLLFHQELASEMFISAAKVADECGVTLDLPIDFRAAAGSAKPDGIPRCYQPWSYTYIRHDGVVQACCFSNDFVMGNLADQSLSEIWNGEKYRRFRSEVNSAPPRACRECELRYRYTQSRDDMRTYIKRAPRAK
jgi:MoaA/NifB/PqqE/SkfB family radical SAM enzyme